MSQEIDKLIDVSVYYGRNKAYVIAGGGNTSYKDDRYLWIKASGVNLSNIDENGFCVLDRQKLNEIAKRQYASNAAEREEEIKQALLQSRVDPASGLRPSVETSLHNLFSYRYVVHTHPTLVNGLMCSNQAAERTAELFGREALYVPYADPGYVLFKDIEVRMEAYRQQFQHDPQVLFIQNHGIFVAADTVEEIHQIYASVDAKLQPTFSTIPEADHLPLSERVHEVVPALRVLLSDDNLTVAKAFNNTLLSGFISDREAFQQGIARPFTPDQMVYCLSEYLFVDETGSTEEVIAEAIAQIDAFKNRRGIAPKVIFIKNEGALVFGDSAVSAGYLKDLVNDFCQIATLAGNFGGSHPLTDEQIRFIEEWEVENYRKKVAMGSRSAGRLENRVVVVTGAAQGFGAGIAAILFGEGANLVIADLNEEKGIAFTETLNALPVKNRARFISVNVAEAESVEALVKSTVMHFGGLDVMISNAGILHAGSLDEMEPEVFELMTRVNYSGFFLCAKYAQRVMKIQHHYRPDFFMDIIQVNSKSGLKGSNKNFAYAGAKFGGIGLTQSFALELMPFRIKVNAICPGNFFDGPLWSDPGKGLFVQYLQTGKVPGAKTIDDVKAFYEAQVPAGRGCTPADVAKAIFYVIDQQYETGQAVPVTGGQSMLN